MTAQVPPAAASDDLAWRLGRFAGRETARGLLCLVLALLETAVGVAGVVGEWLAGHLRDAPPLELAAFDVARRVGFALFGLVAGVLLILALRRVMGVARRWSPLGVSAAAVTGAALGFLVTGALLDWVIGLLVRHGYTTLGEPHGALALALYGACATLLLLASLAASFAGAYAATLTVPTGRLSKAAAEPEGRPALP